MIKPSNFGFKFRAWRIRRAAAALARKSRNGRHVQSTHMISFPVPITTTRVFTPAYIALLLLVFGLIVGLNWTDSAATATCPMTVASK